MTPETRNQKSETRLSGFRSPVSASRGYTLVELIVAVGLFALIMTLAAGAYLVMISVSRQTQAISIGIDNLAFALETMTRTIRTGTGYSCSAAPGEAVDCTNGGSNFSVMSPGGAPTTYRLSGDALIQNGTALTDPSVTVTSLTFYAYGTAKPPDTRQPMVVIVMSGTVSSGPGKTTPFTVETAATMRGTDI